MYCNQCGQVIQENSMYCAACGRAVAGAYSTPRRLTRTREGRKLAGVCQGFAEFFEVDPTLVRIIALLLAIFTVPLAEIAYIVAWVVMPEAPLQLPQAAGTVPPVSSQNGN